MSIKEMEKIIENHLAAIQNYDYQRKYLTNEQIKTNQFMIYCVDELKSQADRMAQLEKQIAELIERKYFKEGE